MLLAIALAASITAVEPTPKPVYEEITGAQAKALIDGLGVSDAQLGKAGDGDPKLSWTNDGVTVVMHFYDCDQGESCRSLQLYAGFGMEDKPSADKIVAWNRDMRYGRAYLDLEGDPCLEMDLALPGGVSGEGIQTWVRTFHTVQARFVKYVGF